jgi:hypothetical protein
MSRLPSTTALGQIGPKRCATPMKRWLTISGFGHKGEAALKEADSSDAVLYTHEEVHTYFAQKRAELLARAAIPDTLATG